MIDIINPQFLGWDDDCIEAEMTDEEAENLLNETPLLISDDSDVFEGEVSEEEEDE